MYAGLKASASWNPPVPPTHQLFLLLKEIDAIRQWTADNKWAARLSASVHSCRSCLAPSCMHVGCCMQQTITGHMSVVMEACIPHSNRLPVNKACSVGYLIKGLLLNAMPVVAWRGPNEIQILSVDTATEGPRLDQHAQQSQLPLDIATIQLHAICPSGAKLLCAALDR